MIKKVVKIILVITLFVGIYIAGVLLYGTFTDYKPNPVKALEVHGEAEPRETDQFSFISWNIGFGGMGSESDFFYDGGDMIIQEEELVRKNLNGITDFLVIQKDIDFFLLQEVDSSSWRSHGLNQIVSICKALPGYNCSYAPNFQVDFIPMPLLSPLGKVNSGIVTFSQYPVEKAERRSYFTKFSWPQRVFFLDRCFLTEEIILESGKKLTVINTHNSAYDTTGQMKAEELKTLLEFAENKYKEGQFVIIGGDWNQCPPNYTPKLPPQYFREHVFTNREIPTGWKWIADPSIPTNRKLNQPYKKGESYTSVIDHFLVSPNVKVEEVKTIDLDFQFSDHQPVYLRVSLKDS